MDTVCVLRKTPVISPYNRLIYGDVLSQKKAKSESVATDNGHDKTGNLQLLATKRLVASQTPSRDRRAKPFVNS